jgi:hypothetical protein
VSSGLYLTGLFILVVSSVVIDRYRKRKKRFNLNLDEQEIRLLKALIVADTIELSTVEVNDILGLSNKNLDIKRRLRLNIISNINH